jgi:hypothetical protein
VAALAKRAEDAFGQRGARFTSSSLAPARPKNIAKSVDGNENADVTAGDEGDVAYEASAASRFLQEQRRVAMRRH